MPKPYIPNDPWARKAAKEGYRARSVYKLQELNERFHMLKPGMTVLDLGAAPGSWLQFTSQKIGPKGLAIGIDRTPIEKIAPNVTTIQADINDVAAFVRKFVGQEYSCPTNAETSEASKESKESSLSSPSLLSSLSQPFDLVLSDIAPNTSGIKDVDQWRSVELNRAVVTIAERVLKPHGTCVLKVFRGGDFDEFLAELKLNWSVRMAHVQASRDRSKEVYIVMRKSEDGRRKT